MAGRSYLHVAYSLSVIVAGLGFLVSLFGGLDLDRSTEFAVLILMGILVEWLTVDFPLGRLSGSFSLILASLIMYNLSASAWISSVAFLVGSGIGGNPVRTSIFNMAQQVLSLYGAVQLTSIIWGRQIPGMEMVGAGSAFTLVTLVVLYFTFNHIFIYLYTYPGRKGARMHTWMDTLRWDMLSYLFSAPFGVVMALLYQKAGLMAATFLFVPMLTVQFITRLYVRSELVNRELRAVYEIARRLGSGTEISRIPDVLLKEMRRAVPFHSGVIYIWDERTRRFNSAAAYGPYRSELLKSCVNPGEGFWGWVINNGDPEVVYDSKIDPRVKSEPGLPQVLRSLLVIPMGGDAGPMGLVIVGEKKSMSFSELDLQAASSLCGTLGAALSNKLLKDRMEKYRSLDPMTGLLNRKSFYNNCRRIYQERRESGEGCTALVLMDLDILGRINEGWGQEAGDSMIAYFGNLIGSIDIPEVLAGRFGDDEFALLLPGFDENKALGLLQEIRNSLYDREVSDQYPLLRIKISAGLGVGPGDGENFDELLKSATRALQQAKKRGRDTVVTASQISGRPEKDGWITRP